MSLAIFQSLHKVFGNILNLLCQKIAIGQIIVVPNGQILKNNLTHLVTLN